MDRSSLQLCYYILLSCPADTTNREIMIIRIPDNQGTTKNLMWAMIVMGALMLATYFSM